MSVVPYSEICSCPEYTDLVYIKTLRMAKPKYQATVDLITTHIDLTLWKWTDFEIHVPNRFHKNFQNILAAGIGRTSSNLPACVPLDLCMKCSSPKIGYCDLVGYVYIYYRIKLLIATLLFLF